MKEKINTPGLARIIIEKNGNPLPLPAHFYLVRAEVYEDEQKSFVTSAVNSYYRAPGYKTFAFHKHISRFIDTSL